MSKLSGAILQKWLERAGEVLMALGYTSWKPLLIKVVAALFKVEPVVVDRVWSIMEELARSAAEEYPAAGTGAQKYEWVMDQAKDLLVGVGPMLQDLILHLVLAYLSKQRGVRT